MHWACGLREYTIAATFWLKVISSRDRLCTCEVKWSLLFETLSALPDWSVRFRATTSSVSLLASHELGTMYNLIDALCYTLSFFSAE